MLGDEATMINVNEQIALVKKEHDVRNHDTCVAASNEARKLLGM